MVHNDAQLFAQLHTLRIIQLNGLNFSTGLSTSPLRAAAILANAPSIFMGFCELMSARGHALLQLFAPVDDGDDRGLG